MFRHSKISPEEIQELKEIHIKIATIQYFCRQQQKMSIGFSDHSYEQAGSLAHNSELMNENERLIAMQKALIPRCRELGKKIASDEEYNQIVLNARKEVEEASKIDALKYPTETNHAINKIDLS